MLMSFPDSPPLVRPFLGAVSRSGKIVIADNSHGIFAGSSEHTVHKIQWDASLAWTVAHVRDTNILYVVVQSAELVTVSPYREQLEKLAYAIQSHGGIMPLMQALANHSGVAGLPGRLPVKGGSIAPWLRCARWPRSAKETAAAVRGRSGGWSSAPPTALRMSWFVVTIREG